MLRHLVALVLILASGCATLDTSRPIEKGTGIWWGTGRQDGHLLGASARERLLEFDVSREAAQRSITESYVAMGMCAGGGAVALTSSRPAMHYVGLGILALSLVPGSMASYDYVRAIDLYNKRFESHPANSGPTLLPYVAHVNGGGEAGLAGRF
jgi:hypothetical protein